MEVLMDQMNYGAPDFQLSSWAEGLEAMMTTLDNGVNQQNSPHSYVDVSLGYGQHAAQSSYVDVSNQQSPTDSSYGDTSTLDSNPALGGNSMVFSDAWFDNCGNLAGSYQSTGFENKSPGFGRRAGPDQLFSRLPCPSEQQPRKSGIQSINQNGSSQKASGDSSGSLLGSSKDISVGRSSKDGLVGSISGGGGSLNQRLRSPVGSNNYMKPGAGKYYQSGQRAAEPQVQQQRQPIPGNINMNWNIVPQQSAPQLQIQQQLLPPPCESEPEDSGLRLVHLLIACAEAIQRGDLLSAGNTVTKINQAVSLTSQHQTGPMGRVAAHFAEALTLRIYGASPNSQEAALTSTGIKPDSLSELLHFYETCPYLKFAHFTANQAILEAFKGAKFVHVIDFNLNHGLQWPALIQALALRQGGPPTLRLTGIGPPELGGYESLQEIGKSLELLAESVNVHFQFRGVVAQKLDDIKPWMLEVRPEEEVAVNSMMQLHKLLYSDASNTAGIDDVLRAVRSLNPKIVAMSEHEANHNTLNFLDRFMEALHFYSSMFDSLEASQYSAGSSEQMLAEMYLGREICNIVACEGADRVERHETLAQWRRRMLSAGFQQVQMGSNAFKQASMLLTLFSGQGYRVEDNQGCLTLCWHGRPLIAASAWHCA